MFIRRELVFNDLERFSKAMKARYVLSCIEPYQNVESIGYTFERSGDVSEYVMVQRVCTDDRGDIALVNKAWTLFRDGNIAAEGLPSIGHVFDFISAEKEPL